MRRVAVVPIEGVLRKPVGGQVNTDGLELYRALVSQYGIILVSESAEKDRTLDWLEKSGVTMYDDIVFYPSLRINTLEGMWTNVLRTLAMRGVNIALVVVNDPESAMEVIERMTPVLMYSQPAYGLPEWLPGRKRPSQPWSELVDIVEYEALARRNDRRMEATE